MKKALLSLFAASVFATVAGCEATPQTNNAGVKDQEGEVITGSRIPRKGGSGADAVTRGSGADYKAGQTQSAK
jgi:hypothetical protein